MLKLLKIVWRWEFQRVEKKCNSHRVFFTLWAWQDKKCKFTAITDHARSRREGNVFSHACDFTRDLCVWVGGGGGGRVRDLTCSCSPTKVRYWTHPAPVLVPVPPHCRPDRRIITMGPWSVLPRNVDGRLSYSLRRRSLKVIFPDMCDPKPK